MGPLVFPSAHLTKACPPPEYAEEIVRIEAELDQIHPPWRRPARSRMGPGIVGSAGIEDVERKARVKWLLQRRKHLYDGKNWVVVVTAIKGRDGGTKLHAHPVIPRPDHTPEAITAAARRSWLRPEEQMHQASLPQIADQLRVPLERVERAVLDAPEGANLLAYVRKKLMAEDVAGAAAQSAPPEKPRKLKVTVT